ncbi:MAG: AMP-binding protein [Actinobacteria bacterium]|nr:AMP-binding protein [Actinomycetota bacterium]
MKIPYREAPQNLRRKYSGTVIDWLRARDSDRVFLETDQVKLSYGEIVSRVEAESVEPGQVLRPRLDEESVVRLLGAIAKGVAVVMSPGSPDPGEIDPGGASMVVFTSGTTGVPKGVRLTLANWKAAGQASVEHLGHGLEDTWLLAMPLYHVAGIGIVLRSAFAGGKVRILPRFDGAAFARALHQVTLASVVPTMLERVLDADTGPFRGLRAVLVGGGPMPRELLERASAAGMPVLPTYGMTETCGQVATLRPSSPVARQAHPLPGVDLRIGDGGRIEVRGPMVSPGYLGEPDRDPDGWFVTGDLGRIDSDGALTVTGRADDTIISGGENIDPVQVEAVLSGHSEVEAVMVVGVASDEWGHEVGCLYVGRTHPAGLEAWARDRLPSSAVPRLWLQIAEMPVTSLGKPDRLLGRSLLGSESR